MPPSSQTAPPGAPIRDIPANLLLHFYNSVSLLMGVVELHSDDILHVIDNAATATFFGTTPDALQGRLASELGVGAADRARWLRHYRKSEETGESVCFHYAHETPDGQRWLKATVSHLGSGSSGADRFSYYAEEVTEQVTQHAALLANEARQEALLGALPDLLFRLDRGGRYLDVHAPDALAAPTEALFGRTLHEVLPENLADRLAAAIEHALDTGTIQLVEYDLPAGNGQRQYFEARVSPDAEHDEALVIVRDRTEQQRSRLKLRATAGRLGSLIRNLQAAVLVEDENGRVVLANQRFCDLFGAEAAPEALVGVDGAEATRTVMPLVRDPEGFAARVTATLEARQRVLAEEVEMAGGRVLERDYIPVELDSAYAGHLWLYRDVTQRKATEQALLQSEARFRSLVEDSSDVITVLDPNGTVRYASDSVERVLGYKPEELSGQNSFALIRPDAVAEVQQAFADVLQRPGQSLTAQASVLHKDGTWRVLSMTGVNLVENPTVEGIVINARDVTPQVKAEQALRSAEAKFRGMVEKSLVGTMIIQDGRFSYVNPRMAEIFGYTPEEMVALPSALDIIHEENRPIVHADLRRSLDQEVDFVSYGVRGRQKDGETIHVELAGVADEYDGRPAVIGTTRDVTAKVEAERRLREQKAQLALIMEAIPDAFLFADVDRRIERVNSAFTRLLGYDAEEALGTTTRQLYADEAAFARTGDERYNREGQVHLDPYPVEYRRKDGSVFVGETVGAPVHTEDGETIGYLGLIRDVTEREAQRQRLASVVALQQAIASFPLDGELQEVLAHVAAEAGHLTGADGAVIELAEGDELVYRGVSGSAEGNLGLRLRIDGSLSGRCVRTGEVVNCVDAEHDERVDREAVRKVGVRSMVIVPLTYRGDSFGVLKVFSGTKTHAFHGDHVATLRLIAGQLAAVISHARAFEAQREREAHFRAVFEHSPYAMALAPVRASIEQVNGAFRRLFDLTDEIAEGLSFRDLTHPDDVDATVEALERLWAGEVESIRLEKRYITRRGREVVADVTVFPLRSEDGVVTHSIAILDDITERERQAYELARSEARYRLLAENMNDLVCLHAPDGTYEWVSPSVRGMLGYHPRELVGIDPYTLFHPDDIERVQHESHERLLRGEESDTSITYRIRHKDGHWVSLETLTQTILDSEGEVEQLQTASRDVSERQEMEDRLYHQAHHDALTGLPNRTLFCKRLDEAVATAEREGEYAVLFLDLDRFKTVNDSLGHTAGDDLLQKVARRLEAQVRLCDTVARFGGDEFAVLLRRLPQPGHAEAVAERITEVLRAPVRIDGRELVASASIGVVTGRADHDSADALLLEADLAMYDAKKSGRGTYATFSPAALKAIGRRHRLEMDLRHAADRGQLRAAYQPVVRLTDGALTGFEALVRWEHPEFGLLYPDAFIELAEESGQVALIDRWILEEACRQTTQWREAFDDCPLLVLNVNCSSRDLVEEGYSEHVRRILDDQRFAPDRLLLEITESLLVEDTELAAAELQRLRDRGVRFCIDDFGTGYSSLSTLHALPIDTIKVDRSFVSKMDTQSRSRKLAETVVRLGRILDKSVVAEGIETPAQLDALRRMGCDCGQGYLFARPLTPEAATALIAADVLPWAEHWKGAAGATE